MMASPTDLLQGPEDIPPPIESTPAQETNRAHAELITAVRELVEQIKEQNLAPNIEKLQLEARNKDPVLKALREERSEGRPKTALQWEQIEYRGSSTVEQENIAHLMKYQDFWKPFESDELETQAVDAAYQSAFDRFDDIYRTLGWDARANLRFDAVLLSQHRESLIESIFAHEAYQMQRFGGLQEPSRASFEYSRLPRLLLILVRIQSRQNDPRQCRLPAENGRSDAQTAEAQTLLKVLSEVARSLRSISWSDGLNRMSLKELLRRCYASNLLQQPALEDVDQYWQHFLLLTDCLMALDFTYNFPEIRDPLPYSFFSKFQAEPIYKIMEMVMAYRRVTRSINDFKQLRLPETVKPTFSPDEFNVEYLQNFGGLNIEWTNSLEEHLKIYTGRNALRIFAHPTYFDNHHDLNRDYHEATSIELSLTYALLFRPLSKNSHLLQKYSSPGAFSDRTLRGDFSFMGHQIQPSKGSEHPATRGCTQIQNIARRNQTKVTSTPMRKVVELAPRYPEDIKIMILALCERDFQDLEPFELFSYFGPRLRQLQTYLDNRQPRTLQELWYDRRDCRSWYMFWAVMSSWAMILLAFVWILITR